MMLCVHNIYRIKIQGDLYMKAVGLVTEYNPFHNGHLYHLNKAMELTGADISVAVMSGDFVQRGEPAVLDKYTRTSMALNSGVNLVVELPVNYAVSSAESFAAGALKVLDYIKADSIAFGSESGNIERLSKLAHILCDNEDTLYKEISKYTANGISYAAARQKVVEKLTDKDTAAMLTSSNNILAVEYLKAIIKNNYAIKPYTVQRQGDDYNDTEYQYLLNNIEQHLLNIKMEVAVHLLENTGLAIYDIAERIGYENLTHFYKMFKKNYHMTPHQYREKISYCKKG